MHHKDVRRQTDSRVDKVRRQFIRQAGVPGAFPFPEQHLSWLRAHVDTYGYGKFRTHEATQALINYTKEHNMTPLQAAINKRGVLVAERDKNRDMMTEFEQATATLAERNAVITTEILGLSATIGAEERKEREAKHKQMADELTAAGYKVAVPVTGTMKYPSFQQIPKGFAAGDLIFVGAPISRGKTRFIEDLIAERHNLSMFVLAEALSGGGKAPGMNTPGTGAGSAQPKLGGVHGVGEGWYRPVVYGSNGVKLEHDFAINTRDHHEARNGWWLKHVPSGHLVKGFPNEAEAYRWIRGYTATPRSPGIMVGQWCGGQFPSIK